MQEDGVDFAIRVHGFCLQERLSGSSLRGAIIRAVSVAAQLTRWAAACGWEALLNRRGTTWRGLPDSDKAAVDQAKALTLMLDHPALIKRPIFEMGKQVLVGFDKTTQETLLAG